jgi:outer membrane receptor protein involved in Fe transport
MRLSPKANLIYSLDQDTEIYASAGRGFHSNDARGTTIAADPATGAPADKVSPLVPSRAATSTSV